VAKKKQRDLLWEYIESVAVAIIIAIVLRTFVVAAYKIPTGSMIPTLKIGDCLFALKLPYGVHIPFTKFILFGPHQPDRGDVIVFKYPEDQSISFVKRVIGVPGDKIEIRQKRVFINDQILKYKTVENNDPALGDIPMREMYIVQKETVGTHEHYVMFRRGEDDDSYGPIVVPDGKLFVLGDNRDSSDDSRSWGLVPYANLEGKSFFIWLSLDWERRGRRLGFPRIRSERLFTLIR
jgi:signal peptidase I